MIKLRLASMAETTGDLQIDVIEGELLSDALVRLFKDSGITETISEVFNVTINGEIVDSGFWGITKLKKDDSVIVAPRLRDSRNIGQVLVIVAVAITAAYTGGASAGFTPLQAGLINAGVAVVSSYLVSQLIPPPIIPTSESAISLERSQTYSISSQSNQVRKFLTVPKVYGRHRIFPVVAANPYTELEADPNTGIYSQYFYAIYDFGLGPVTVEDLKIGNTPISKFDQVTYNLVDLKKPNVNEGAWDVATRNAFTIYKGDISSEAVGTTLNGNKAENDPADDYLAERNAATNPSLLKQEITLNLVCPRGLYAFDSVGNIGYRNIEIYVEYSPAGLNTWKPFNDPSTVSKWSMVGGGGSQAYTDIPMTIINPDTNNPRTLTRFSETQPDSPWQRIFENYNTFSQIFTYIDQRTVYRGYPTGTLQVVMTGEANVGENIKVGDRILGKVQTKTYYGFTDRDYYTYTFQAPTTFPVNVWVYTETRIRDIYFGITLNDNYGYELKDVTRGAAREIIIPGKFQIRAKTQEQHFATLKFTPNTPGEYKVRITRNSTSSANTTNVIDELTWININTRSDTNPIKTTKRHTFMEVRIKASGQLNGALQNLSAVCTSVLDTWNGTAWVKAPTQNPAWVYADLLTGEVAKKPVAKSRLDIATLYEWAQYCAAIPTSTNPDLIYTAPRFTSNFVLDFEPTLQNLLQQISSAAQATPNMIDGKYGVLLDINRTTPVQLFTPRNSWGFTSTRGYNNKPHAIRVKFVDPTRDWQQNETLVYDDGYNSNNSTEIQDLDTFGVTNKEQASRYGRFFAAQHRLRQETYQLKVDFEHLVCNRGDYVVITQDVMKAGGTPARVKSISGNQIVIDDRIIVTPGAYGYTFRKSNGQIITNTLAIVSSDTFDLNGPTMPAPGELIVIGKVGSITFDCIVKSISPEQDFSATLTLVEKANGVYAYENNLSIQTYDPKIAPTIGYEEVPPPQVTNLVVVDNRIVVTSTGIDYFIDIDWDMPLGSSFESFEVYIDEGLGFELATVIKNSVYTHQVNESQLGIEHKFKVLAVSASGKKLTLGEVDFVSATPIKYTAKPPDVTGFTAEISGETIQFFWDKITGKAITEYMIRYSPDFNGTWEQSTIVNRVSANTNLYSTQARLGAYFIKAINSNLDESENAAKVRTTVPQLPGMNFIDTITDFPGLIGSTDKTIVSTNIVLDQSVFGPIGSEQFYAEGFYYMNDTLDLGEVFSVRLTSKIIAQGISYGDLMVNWLSLSSVPALSTVSSSDWDVELQYRTIDNFIPISSWTTLASIASIGAGAGTFTEWRKFLVGDATGKLFQFRLKLISYNPSVTPRVISAEVLAEMPNRREDFPNLSAPNTGLQVDYLAGFYGPGSTPNVQISLLNGQSGDYWVFTSQTLNGFNIVFYNNLGNPVARQFSATATGYGRKSDNAI